MPAMSRLLYKHDIFFKNPPKNLSVKKNPKKKCNGFKLDDLGGQITWDNSVWKLLWQLGLHLVETNNYLYLFLQVETASNLLVSIHQTVGLRRLLFVNRTS